MSDVPDYEQPIDVQSPEGLSPYLGVVDEKSYLEHVECLAEVWCEDCAQLILRVLACVLEASQGESVPKGRLAGGKLLQRCFDFGQSGVEIQVLESMHRIGDLDGAVGLPPRIHTQVSARQPLPILR